MPDAARVIVTAVSPRAPVARALIGELDAYLNATYPPEKNYLLDIEALCQPGVTFFVAHVGEQAAGCGAVRRLHDQTFEIKRMYVRPAFRGRRVGRALLETLEAHARASGAVTLVLETGVLQQEALSLYERAGYVRRERYGEYREDSTSLFFEKQLPASSAV